MKKPKAKFGVKNYKEVKRKWYEDEKAIKMLVVEFLNGRVYHSKWHEDMPYSRLYSHKHADPCPLKEQEMEFLVVENLCRNFFDPCLNKD